MMPSGGPRTPGSETLLHMFCLSRKVCTVSTVDKYIYLVYWCREEQRSLQNCSLEEGFSGEESGAALHLDSWILLSVLGTSTKEEQMFINNKLRFKLN